MLSDAQEGAGMRSHMRVFACTPRDHADVVEPSASTSSWHHRSTGHVQMEYTGSASIRSQSGMQVSTNARDASLLR